MSLKLKRNDTVDIINYTLVNEDNSTPDLTGATVKFFMGDGISKIVATGAATVVNVETAEVEYAFSDDDTLFAGKYKAEFEVTFQDGKVKSYPRDSYIEVHIQPNVNLNKSTQQQETIAMYVSQITEFKNEVNTKVDAAVTAATNAETSAAQVTAIDGRVTELEGAVDALIDDVNPSTDAVFSSQKVSTDIATKADKTAVGELANLTTTDKSSVVAAINEHNASLAQKLNKGEGGSITWAMAAQDFREQITGGNTAVVGIDSVLTENIVNEAVTPEKTSFTKSGSINAFNFNDNSVIDNYYIGAGGAVLASSTYAISHKISCKNGDVIRRNTSFNETYNGAVYDSNDNLLGIIGVQTYSGSNFEYTIPYANASYVKLNLHKTVEYTLDYFIITINTAIPNEHVPFNYKLDEFYTLNEKQIELVEKIASQPGSGELQNNMVISELPNGVKNEFSFTDGTFIKKVSDELKSTTYGTVSTTKVNVDTYRIFRSADITDSVNTFITGLAMGCVLKYNGQVVEQASDSSFDDASLVGKYITNTNGVWLIVNKGEVPVVNHTFIYQLATPQTLDLPDEMTANTKALVKIMEKTESLPYSDKILSALGDSLTDEDFGATIKYTNLIQKELGFTVNNFGDAGTGYMRTFESGTAFYQRASSIPVDTDVVTIFGSGNDLAHIGVLGTASDTFDDANKTIAGCINHTIDIIQQRIPKVRIGIIAPTPWSTTPTHTSNSMWQYVDLLEEICKLRGIPFLNLYRRSNLRPWETENNDLFFFNSDGTHPNNDGQKMFIYPPYREFVKSII